VVTAVVLIDGTELAKHTIAHSLSLSRSFDVKRIDTDYFGEG